MPRTTFPLIACCFAALASCSREERADRAANPTPSSASAQVAVDACALLTSEEIASVQGQPYQKTKPSVQAHGGLTVSQCYFALPTPSDSVVLSLTQATTADVPVLRKQWDEILESARGKVDKGEQGESAPPRELPGLGEQAFWKGSGVGGALHVLQGDIHFQISVGGPGDLETKIDKSQALAKSVLRRLQPNQ